MKCLICKKTIASNELLINDYYQKKTDSYHLECHIKKFGDIKLYQEQELAKQKISYVQSIGSLSNLLFMIILFIVIVFGIFVIVWVAI